MESGVRALLLPCLQEAEVERGGYLWSVEFSKWSHMGVQLSEPGCYCRQGVKCYLSSLGLFGLNDYLFGRILFIFIHGNLSPP